MGLARFRPVRLNLELLCYRPDVAAQRPQTDRHQGVEPCSRIGAVRRFVGVLASYVALNSGLSFSRPSFQAKSQIPLPIAIAGASFY